MDYIEVVDLEVFAYHGVLDSEKMEGQKFYLSFKAYMDLETSALDDDLSLSVSYADMCKTVKNFVQSSKFDLIETVADGAAKKLLKDYKLIRSVVLKVKKPSAPIKESLAYPLVCVDRRWSKAYVGIGSNLGDREATVKSAVESMEKGIGRILKIAKLIETDPWGPVPQGPYINTVVEIETLLTPSRLMKALLNIEKEHGRTRDIQWGPRTLDLDVLFYEDLVSEDPNVILPHPYVHERLFVLESLMDLCPNKIHPIYGKPLRTFYEKLRQE